MPRPPDREPVVEFAPPLTSVAWSSAFVAQSLDVLFVYLGPEGAHHLRPIHADTLRLGWPPDRKPGEIVLESVDRYELRPVLVHSTSWRHEEGRLILLRHRRRAARARVSFPRRRAGRARGPRTRRRPRPSAGDSGRPGPRAAFRHLAWLVKDDAVVGETLSDWIGFLDMYEPEPFRAFGPILPT